MPQGHLSKGIDTTGCNTVVYDTDAYSYSTILELLHNTGGKRLRLATYSTRTKKLITEDAVFDYGQTAQEK